MENTNPERETTIPNLDEMPNLDKLRVPPAEPVGEPSGSNDEADVLGNLLALVADYLYYSTGGYHDALPESANGAGQVLEYVRKRLGAYELVAPAEKEAEKE